MTTGAEAIFTVIGLGVGALVIVWAITSDGNSDWSRRQVRYPGFAGHNPYKRGKSFVHAKTFLRGKFDNDYNPRKKRRAG